jgi:hypothetical protein
MNPWLSLHGINGWTDRRLNIVKYSRYQVQYDIILHTHIIHHITYIPQTYVQYVQYVQYVDTTRYMYTFILLYSFIWIGSCDPVCCVDVDE